ncbi:hypothetical protein AB0M94_37240 [Streptomyces xanthochromogenes]|uniref:Uncharacterized protein n=1 Tax=Streptomyces xanthochromogenes TaxID=67384 RepID=A0ABQ2ZVH4_9ACTN|nr:MULTISPECIES: hypothetical protein [Streptomyces]MYV88988.1 hypothetical protein [Streptomyces sp. SID1034]GGY23476.1 hypothetical protein GCM10010326_16260 [Streptomyces xanthochromogenes]
MNANVGLAVSVSDDLVIEEFGRQAAFGQVPMLCSGSGVAPIPASAATETSRRTV